MTFPSKLPLHAETPALDTVALHLLRAMVKAAKAGRATHLEELASAIGVRKADCRQALSTLHRQGYVDVLRMRPTFEGFAVGAALRGQGLKAPRDARLRTRDLPADLLSQVEVAHGPAAEIVALDRGRSGGPRTSEPPPSSRAA